MRKILLSFALIILLFSCSTFTSTEGPEWTRTTPHPSGAAAFVGNGTGTDDSSARASAYMNILEKLGTELGYDVVSPYYRELLSTDSIASLSARITNTYSAPVNEGVTYYAMLEMPEDVYYSSRSEEYSAAIERTEKIGQLLESAMENYRENKDTATLLSILQALELSLSGDVNNADYAPELLLDRALGYLGNIGISIEDGSKGTEVSVRMRRMKGLMHPYIVDGLVEVRYMMVNGDGEPIESSVVMRTDRDGMAEFFRTNPYMLWSGALRYSPYIPPELLTSIASKAPEGFIDPLLSLLEESTVEYRYRDEGELSPSDTIIAVAEYGEDGLQLEITAAYNAFASYLASSSASGYRVVSGEGEEESEVISSLMSLYPNLDNYILLRVGIVDSESGAGRVYARAEARLSFYRNGEEEPYLVRDLIVTGGGSTEEEAGETALKRAGSAGAGMFLSVL